MTPRRALGVGVLGGALVLLAWLLLRPQDLPVPEGPVIRPASEGSARVHRVVRPVSSRPIDGSPSVEPTQDGLGEALDVLARIVGGAPVDCAAPPDLASRVRVPGLRRPTAQDGRLRAVAERPSGSAGLFLDRDLDLEGCERLFDADTDCAARRREVVAGTLRPVAVVRWDTGPSGASCTVEPVRDVPFTGTVVRDDGSAPDDAEVFGCERVVADGASFRGTAIDGIPCALFARADGGTRTGTLLVPGAPPRDGLRIVLGDRRDPPPDGPTLFSELEAAVAEGVRADTPETRALADPSLSPGARAIVHGWVEDDLARAAHRLEVLREVRAFSESL